MVPELQAVAVPASREQVNMFSALPSPSVPEKENAAVVWFVVALGAETILTVGTLRSTAQLKTVAADILPATSVA